MNLPRLAVRRPIAWTLLMIAVFVLGLFALGQLPVDFLPDITYPVIKVQVFWQGATPGEIENDIAEPLEQVLSTVDDLDALESTSIEGVYSLDVTFRYGTDMNVAYQDVLAKMRLAERRLPTDVEPPLIFKADPSQLPIVDLAVSSAEMDAVRLRTWVEDVLQDRLIAVPGVGGTEIVGGLEREIRVLLDPRRLRAYSLSAPQVAALLAESNVERLGGRVTSGPREIIVRTTGEFQSLDEIRQTILRREPDGRTVRLADVAKVQDGHREQRIMSRLNGAPCVRISIFKQATANTVEVARMAQQEIGRMQRILPPGMRIETIQNQAETISDAISGVRSSAIAAGVLVILSVYLFMGRLRQILVMLVALPLTLVGNFALMKLGGFSLNIFSLGGLVVAMGIVLDNSIVVMENIARTGADLSNRNDAAAEGAREVALPVIAGTLTVLTLFVPFLLVSGMISLLFRELILTVGGIVVVSLIVALTITPMLSAKLLKRDVSPTRRWLDRLTSGFARSLSGGLRLRWFVLLLSLFFVVGGMFLLRQVGTEFLPEMDDGLVTIKVVMPTGTAIAETDRVLVRLERMVLDDPLVARAYTLVGGRSLGLSTQEIAHEGEISLQLVPRGKRPGSTFETIRALSRRIAKARPPGAMVKVMHTKVKGIRGGRKPDVEVKLRGPELSELGRLASAVASSMRGIPGLINLDSSLDINKPEFAVEVDRDRAAGLGLTVQQVAAQIRSLIGGIVSTHLREAGETTDVRVLVPEDRLSEKRDIEQLPLSVPGGSSHYLYEVARVTPVLGPVQIAREGQVKQVTVSGYVDGRTVGEVVSDVHRKVAGSLALPEGYTVEYGGQFQLMAEGIGDIGLILILALFLAFVVLGVQFESFSMPLLVLMALPLPLAGMIGALYLTGMALGVPVIIGTLVVTAALISDGVLLLSFVERLRTEGMPVREALVEASRLRFRPRIMTTLTTVVGFLPLALNWAGGGEMLQPMAIAAIGGLLVEIPAVLYVVPCLYLIGRK